MKKKNKIKPGNLVAWNGTQVVPATANNNNIIGVAAGVTTTTTSTGSIWATTGEELKRTKHILRCSVCKKKMGEYYSSWQLAPYASDDDNEPMCKTCHQIDKLIE